MSSLTSGARPITCTLRVNAPAERVFELLSDPRRHPELDGSGTLRGLVTGPPRLRAGDRFEMAMRYWGIPYTITNRVVEFEPDRLIAWTHLSAVIWRYQLRPLPDGTEISQTWDPTGSPCRVVYRWLGFAERTTPAMMRTLERIRTRVEP